MIPKVCFSPMWFLKIITQLKFVYVYARVREYIPLRSVAYIIFQKTFFFYFLVLLAIFMEGLNYLSHTSSYRSSSGYIMRHLSLSDLK